MATNFPTSLDAFTNPTAVDTLDSPPHDVQHADANDAIEALQAKVGVDGSAVTSSLDYQLANIGTWTSYTPTLDQAGAVAKTVAAAQSTQINEFVSCFVRLEVTGTGTTAQPVKVGLPVAATNTNISAGQASIYDATTGAVYNGFAFTTTTTEVFIVGDWAGTGVWGTSPSLPLGSGDVIWLQLNYKVA